MKKNNLEFAQQHPEASKATAKELQTQDPENALEILKNATITGTRKDNRKGDQPNRS